MLTFSPISFAYRCDLSDRTSRPPTTRLFSSLLLRAETSAVLCFSPTKTTRHTRPQLIKYVMVPGSDDDECRSAPLSTFRRWINYLLIHDAPARFRVAVYSELHCI